MNQFKRLFILALAFSICACSSSLRKPPKDPRQDSVGGKEFFFYNCVREYMIANAIEPFDGSVEYGVEFSYLSSKDLNEIHQAAIHFVSKIEAPNYKDKEHGRPAVLVLCQKESMKW